MSPKYISLAEVGTEALGCTPAQAVLWLYRDSRPNKMAHGLDLIHAGLGVPTAETLKINRNMLQLLVKRIKQKQAAERQNGNRMDLSRVDRVFSRHIAALTKRRGLITAGS